MLLYATNTAERWTSQDLFLRSVSGAWALFVALFLVEDGQR